jgi:hypothetical protein
MSDPYPVAERVKLPRRAVFCFAVAAVMYVLGVLLVLRGAFVESADDSSGRLGVLFFAVGTFGVFAGFRLRYLRTHPLRPDRALRSYVWRQVAYALVLLPVGLAALLGAVSLAPWVAPEFNAIAFGGTALVAAVLLPLVWFSGVGTLRHARRLRRLVSQPGQRWRLIQVALEDQLPLVLISGPDGPASLWLIPRQDLSRLSGHDGMVEVVGTLRHRETVLLRNAIGEPIWPTGPARTRLTLGSLL